MSYLIYFGMALVAGGGLIFVSQTFAHEVSRRLEAMFDFIEYRLALRAQEERRSYRREARPVNVTPLFRANEVQRIAKGSTQPLSIARIAA